ncbi:isoleucine--tRNA ligase [Candidatus Woesearchaeota archaeon]|nr:isoleucine--tRNA ligase [Candidatus Woesearchaeota archaeon]
MSQEPKNYDFRQIESEILDYWKENLIFDKAKAKNRGRKIFYFLDGPPYTSGKVHIGTAWNKSLKDAVLRYKRMSGLDVWDRAGYDMHGLPTENAVQKNLNLKNKDDIPKYGVQKFIEECRAFSTGNLKIMNEDFKRMGIWMDFDNAYQSIKNEFMEGEWWLVKKAHEKGRLYEGEKPMHWCGHCATALAKHELEYQDVEDDSIFVKFPVVGKKNEFLIIWTTTPWTIPYNLGVMVNPELEYVKAQVDDEVWIVAAGLVAPVVQAVANKRYKVLETFMGEQLKGIKYHHPFEKELKKRYDELRKESDKIHSVVLSEEYVDLSAGTGLVHMAPGCGPEDYAIGHREGIPGFNNLQEDGSFPDDMGKFSKLVAKVDDKRFIEALREEGALIETTKVSHDYAHCWRCHKPVIFKLTKQWFFKIEDLKENMRELNKDIYWVPDWAGNRQFDSWLDNLRDNGITRQRYWGTPVPIWRCDKCEAYDVIGSVRELQEKAGKVPDDLHIPYIDEIKWGCKCGGEMKRVPDVLDVWIDAGTTSWSCLDYPQRTDLFESMFPPDFILEGKDQIRGWFNLLFVASMISMEKTAFKAVYMHGFVQDSQGRKMSKSLGNYILPEEVIGQYGADTLRYYMIGGANPGIDINYNFDDMKTKHKNLMILWNLMKYLLELGKTNKIGNAGKISIEERYILSKLHSTIKDVTEKFEGYFINNIPWKIEELLLELSRTYIQLIRDKAASGEQEDKDTVTDTIFQVMMGVLKMFSTIAPFISEKVYLELKNGFGLKEESISLYDWPKYDQKMIDVKLEQDFEHMKSIIGGILSAREAAQLGVRWPLLKAVAVSEKKQIRESAESLKELIISHTNIRGLEIKEKIDEEEKLSLKEAEFPGGTVYIDISRNDELEAEGFMRELIRRVQVQRKKTGLMKEDKINIIIKSQRNELFERSKEQIREKVGASGIRFVNDTVDKAYPNRATIKIKGLIFEIFFEKHEPKEVE